MKNVPDHRIDVCRIFIHELARSTLDLPTFYLSSLLASSHVLCEQISMADPEVCVWGGGRGREAKKAGSWKYMAIQARLCVCVWTGGGGGGLA